MPRQLTFDLPVRTALGRDDFFVSPANDMALAALDGDWPQNRLLLTGPPGSGKSHLTAIWAAESGADILPATDLPDALEKLLAAPAPLAVEDIDKAPDAEEALFHLLNAQSAHGRRLLLTATRPPGLAPISLPDLASRLQGMALATLNPPDDALLAAIMVKLFRDRQLAAPPEVISFLLSRTERSFAGARNLVENLDRAALTEGRRLSTDLARQVLDKDSRGAR